MLPDWSGPVVRYILEEGLPGTLRVAAYSLVGSTIVGIVLGTLITIRFRPSQALIRLYIEVFRGLPILVTVFIVFFGLPSVSQQLKFEGASHAGARVLQAGDAMRQIGGR